MDALVKAAKAEGKLNVIALPPTWANYGKIIDGFEKKYPGITINSANPNGSSADEIAAVKSQKGQSTAPDVLDLGNAVMQQNLGLLTDYKVANWSDIPDTLKDKDGKWTRDYTGLMSIGYDSSKIKQAPKDLNDLLGSEYKGKVSIAGDPTQANQAASAVYLAALENGGSADDITKGVEFFGKLKQAGNFQNVLPSQATVASGGPARAATRTGRRSCPRARPSARTTRRRSTRTPRTRRPRGSGRSTSPAPRRRTCTCRPVPSRRPSPPWSSPARSTRTPSSRPAACRRTTSS
ncbi:ABC transporter substrate-binding protein [Curtobacterium sp. Csp1]|uniref:ABC transporter substrate-binding protein n=1 Tax=Curtobacterium sp. Csp1 TaxID=2495429 RepID=UPI0034A0B0B8